MSAMTRPDHDQSAAWIPGPAVLNARQREILSLLEQGLGNAELARRCALAESTVKWYLHELYERFGVRNRTALLHAVRRCGLQF